MDTTMLAFIGLLNGQAGCLETLSGYWIARGVSPAESRFAVLCVCVELSSHTGPAALLKIERAVHVVDTGAAYLLPWPNAKGMTVVAFNGTEKRTVMKLAEDVRAAAQEDGGDATVGVGRTVFDPLQLPLSFALAQKAMAYRFLGGPGGVYHCDRLDFGVDDTAWQPAREAERLADAVVSGVEVYCREIVRDIFDAIRRYSTNVEIARCRSCFFADTVIQMVRQLRSGDQALQSEAKRLADSPFSGTLEQVRKDTENLAVKLCMGISSSHGRVRQMLDYVDTHFREASFSAQDMAQNLGISQSRMCQVFKKSTDRSILDYVTDLRMNYIKSALIDTNLPVRDIIASAGYSDVPNCSRRFKQREGITPGQYRRINRFI